MTQVLSHARKITCADVRRMRGLSVVFSPPVAYKGIAIACEREEDCHHEDGSHPEEEELAAG